METIRQTDEFYMRLALKEALKGKGFTKTNPLVGAVIVKDNCIVSTGYHKKFGGDHAEIDAINNTAVCLKDSTIYVTLEPCSTTGKTPPCTEAILNSSIKRVVIGAVDPNPLHFGKGIEILKNNKVEVISGVLSKESEMINKPFFTNILKRRPYICLKMAMTLDGKIATSTGNSKWITNSRSRKFVHRLRNEYDAVMVGKNTVLYDNPSLTVRDVKVKRQPNRILVDSSLEVPLTYNIFKKSEDEEIFCITSNADVNKSNYIRSGITLIESRNMNLHHPIKELLEFNISSILVEGGSRLAGTLLKEKVVDKIMFFYAPKILGNDGIGCIGSLGIDKMINSIPLKNIEFVKRFGDDILIQADLDY